MTDDDAKEAPRKRGLWRRPPDIVLSVATPIVLLCMWEALAAWRWIDPRFFPRPTTIVATAYAMARSGEMLVHLEATGLRVVCGFVIGTVLGVTVGLALGAIRVLRVMFDPILSAIYVIPKIAILPLVMIVFGLGEGSKIAIVALGTFFTVAINSMAGVRMVDAVLIEAGRNFGARGFKMFRHVLLPAALPQIFTGFRLGAGVALLVVIAAEFVAADAGVGFLIWRSWSTLVTEAMYVGFAMIATLGVVVSWLVYRIGALVMPWQNEHVDLLAVRREDT
jgi:ABC-type nitrate/sulfonate/bicarbonate transport system permease component